MKHSSLLLFTLLLFTQKTAAQSLSFQDSTFTEPVILTDFPDGVTFERCRFVGITADAALTLINVRYAGISGCTFEDIQGTAVLVGGTQGSDLFYMFLDTMHNVQGTGVAIRKAGRVEIYDCQLSNISGHAIELSSTRRVEVIRDQLSDVGSGITCFGSGKVDSLYIGSTSIRRVHGVAGEPESGNGIRIANTGLAIIEYCILDSCMANGLAIGQGNSDSTAVDSVVISNNLISRSNFDGVLGAGNARHGYLHDNEISYPGLFGGHPNDGDHGIRWEGPDCRIEDNSIHYAVDTACSQAYCGAGISVGNSGLVARNHIHDCTGNGIEYVHGQPAGQQDLRIFNNIVYDVAGNPMLIQGGNGTNGEPAHIIIRNNTLLGIFRGDTLRNAPLAVCCNANQVTAQGNLLLFEDMADTSQFVQLEGAGTLLENLNLKATDTLGFVDYAARNFHLSATSAALNFLPVNFGEPNDDIDREPRDPLHDAGADELLTPSSNFCGCVNCPAFMPDNFVGSFLSLVNDTASNDLAGAAQVCGVRIHFDHEYLGDLSIRLVSPAGQSVTLVEPIGFFGPTDATDWEVMFVPCSTIATPDQGFSASWSNNQPWGQTAYYSGSYYPSTGCLEEFDTGPVGGEWSLVITDGQAVDVGNLYDFEVLFCNTTGLDCQACEAPPVANLVTRVLGQDVFLQDLSIGATGYQFDFGDGTSFTGAFLPGIHTYADTGTYLLRLIASNLCGTDTLEQIIQVTAFAIAEPASGCAPLSVHITIPDSAQVEEWHWFFPGATPAASLEAEPTVVYQVPGVYTATLVAIRAAPPTGMGDTLHYSISITVRDSLVTPGFTIQVQGDSIIATNTTQGFTALYWSLNDNLTDSSSAQQQVYVVDSSGVYLITLYVANDCDTALIQQSVPVTLSGLKNAEKELFELSLLPNPSDGQCQLALVSPEDLPGDIVVLNAAGQKVFAQKIEIRYGKNKHDLNLSHLPPGFYLLRLQTVVGWKTISFVLQK